MNLPIVRIQCELTGLIDSIGAVAYVSDELDEVAARESSSKLPKEDVFESSFAIFAGMFASMLWSSAIAGRATGSSTAATVESLKLSNSSITANREASDVDIDGGGRIDTRGPDNGSKRSKIELRQLALLPVESPFDSKKSKSDGFKITGDTKEDEN